MMNSCYNTKEFQERRVELPDVSKEGLECFINYVYLKDFPPRKVTCEVGLELLRIAHMYEITDLKDLVLKYIVSRKFEWFTPDGVLGVYYFVRNIAEFSNLKELMMDHMQR